MPLNSNALTSISDVKESLGIVSSDHTKDNLITRKINQASQQIENYCNRVFRADDYTEYVTGSSRDSLVLSQRPINSVTSVSFRTSNQNINDFEDVNAQDYFIDETSGILRFDFNTFGRWENWKIVYNAGYSKIPSDLAEACATLASYLVSNPNGGLVANVRAKTEGSRKIEYNQGLTSFNNLLQQLGIDDILDSYANNPILTE